MSEEGFDDVREQHRARFDVKLQEYVAQKKSSQVKTDDNYNEILEAVKGWNKGEKFTDGAIKRNYGRRFAIGNVNGKKELLHDEKSSSVNQGSSKSFM